MATYEFHELANIFPILENEHLYDLATDISENGLLEPIVLYEGKILDGRNRYRACLRLGTRPKFVEFKGKDPLKFVLSTNLHRRHLTESQRAMVAAKLANLKDGQRQVGQLAEVPTQSEAAEKLNVGERSVRRAREVLENGTPELQKAVEDGEVSVSAAAELADLPEEEQAEIISSGPERAKQVISDLRKKKASDTSNGHESAAKALMKWREKFLYLGIDDLEGIVREVFGTFQEG